MVDFRLYRLAFGPALVALVALMFSLAGVPPPLEPAVPPASFEAGRAAALARTIAERAPERTPGSEEDELAADLVRDEFEEVAAGTVSEQELDAEFEGDDITLRNVIVTLPGEAEDAVVVLAARDAARAPSAASSAAATGALAALATALGVTGHEKTFILASTSGGASGAAGARRLIDGLPDPDAVESVLVLSQPAAPEPSPPFAVESSTRANRSSAQLVATVERALETQTGRAPESPGPFAQLSRLAIPSGIGEQAPLVADGRDAVALSSAGERPLPPARDGVEDLSVQTLGQVGRAAHSAVQAIDAADAPLAHGPDTYVEVGDNLVPGWTLSVLGLALILPSLVAAVDAAARCRRRNEPLGAACAWAASRPLPLLGGLAAVYLLALIGVVPRPAFPFDPGRFPVDLRAVVAMALVTGVVVASARALRIGRCPAGVGRGSLAAGLGLVSAAAAVLVWLSNPYLGLLAAPAASAWLLASGGRGTGAPWIAAAAVGGAVLLLPLALALVETAAALELGGDTPWTMLLLVADGQIGLVSALSLCVVVATVVAAAVACAAEADLDKGPIGRSAKPDDLGADVRNRA